MTVSPRTIPQVVYKLKIALTSFALKIALKSFTNRNTAKYLSIVKSHHSDLLQQ
jgi:hypothetical protein